MRQEGKNVYCRIEASSDILRFPSFYSIACVRHAFEVSLQ